MVSLKKPINIILSQAKEFHSDGDSISEKICYDKLYSIYSTNFKLLKKVLEFQEEIESWDSCLKTISLMKNFDHNTGLLCKEAVFLSKLDRNEEAIVILKDCAIKDKLFETYNLLVSNCCKNSELRSDAFIYFKEFLNKDELNRFTNYSLAMLYYDKAMKTSNKDFTLASQHIAVCYDQEPNNSLVLILYGLITSQTKNYRESLTFFMKALDINSDNAIAHSNLGFLLSQDIFPGEFPDDLNFDDSLSGGYINHQAKALFHITRAIELNPKDYISAEHLGNSLRESKYFSEAIKVFKTIPNSIGDIGLIESYYANEDYNNFTSILNKFSSSDEFFKSREVSAILSHSDIHIDTNIKNYFCPNPLNYIEVYDIPELDNSPNFTNRLLNEIDNFDFGSRKQKLLTNGIQTSNNIFDYGSSLPLVAVLKEYISNTADGYRNKYDNTKTGMIKHWPESLYINGWIIKMKDGGFLTPHNHIRGWISGVFYLQVPKKNKSNEGDIRFCLSQPNFPKSEANFPIKDIKTFDSRLVLFPSSLFHQTIPFSDSTTRICIAFDMQPV